MAAMLRIPVALLLLLAAVTVLGGTRAQWAACLGLEELDLAALRVLVDGPRRAQEILNKDEIVRRRLRGKYEITRGLLEGRVTLFEAAAGFRKVEGQTREYIGYSHDLRSGETADEMLCRQVIRWVGHEAAVGGYPDPGQTAQRLEEELREHLRQHGTVRLTEE
jgi:hypothetical protein